MTAPADLHAAASELFAGPREDFIAARARLAKAAKAAGAGELAAAIAALVKPSASAWAVCRVWWDAPERIRELFAAAAELRAAALGGAGPHALAAPRARHREALAAATEAAAAALGGAPAPTMRRRIATTLEALGALGRWPPPGPGCLAADLDPPGFEALGAVPVASFVDDAAVEAGANDGVAAAQLAAAAQRAAAHLDECQRRHDDLAAVHRARVLAREQATAALARAQLEHDAAQAAEAAAARDLDQRVAELAEATAAHAAARAALTDKP